MFLQETWTFSQQGCIKLIKSDRKDFYTASISHKFCFRSPEDNNAFYSFHKNIKDHVTL